MVSVRTAAVLLALVLPPATSARPFPERGASKAPPIGVQQQATAHFAPTGRVQFFTAPSTGVYNFTAAGAGVGGGHNASVMVPSGRGAVVTGTSALQAGDVLAILVGSPPPVGSCGGAGGSFVARVGNNSTSREPGTLLSSATPLFVAGGGGRSSESAVGDASLTQEGKAGAAPGGAAGGGGSSAAAASDASSCAGGGFFHPGAAPAKPPLSGFFDPRFWGERSLLPCGPGGAFLNGGLGGASPPDCGTSKDGGPVDGCPFLPSTSVDSPGGFGGGGGARKKRGGGSGAAADVQGGCAASGGGGGGGYSGGGGGGGGGGSFGASPFASAAATNEGPGYVIATLLSPGEAAVAAPAATASGDGAHGVAKV